MLGYLCDLTNDALVIAALPDEDGVTAPWSQVVSQSGASGKAVLLSGHSIWETPEGKWVEVTHGAGVARQHLFTPAAFGMTQTFTLTASI